MVECSVHRKKRSWDKIEVTADKKWVCVASCPCVVHLGGSEGWCRFLREALKSRGEEELLEAVEALAGSDDSNATATGPGHGGAPQGAPTERISASNLESQLATPAVEAASLLEGEIDPDDL